MKKKYSTLLNFALAGCLATTLAACGSDGDKTGLAKANSESNPKIDIGGTVVDTNGNPMADIVVSCQGSQAKTNSSGQWINKGLKVTNVEGLIDSTGHPAVRCVVEAPAGYLGAIVSVYPEAQMDSQYAANGDNGDDTTYVPIVTFIDGMYAEAGTAWLPKLGSTVYGRIENCDTEASVDGAIVKLDMLAVDNNYLVSQAGSACTYGCAVDYSTAMYSSVTGADGDFSIANVPDDTILRMYVEGYEKIDISNVQNTHVAVVDSSLVSSGYGPESTPGSLYITTVDEGMVYLGDVCVDNIGSGDGVRPCVLGVKDYVHAEAGTQTINRSYPGLPDNSSDTISWAVLPDDVDGTGDGFVVVFSEKMDETQVDENSVVIWNEGPDPLVTSDDDYLTDFTATLSGNGLRIVTAAPLGDDDHLKIYLLLDDFQDGGGNYLTSYDAPDDAPSNDCNQREWVQDFWSLNDTGYVVLGVKMFSPDDTDVGEVTGLAQQCLDYSAVVADQTDLQAEYPTTFRSDSASNNNFSNLNKDADYEDRLEALADVLECPTDTTYEANVVPGYASVIFTAPTSGAWELASGAVDCGVGSCDGTGDGASHTVVVRNADVGDSVCIDTLDDFDNTSAQECVTLGDCVAPTTVLNFAYNTCGHVGYNPSGSNTDWHANGPGDSGPGYDTEYAAHLCVDFEVATLFEYGDGGENTAEGTPGVCGTPTLNITCRLLKDPADAATGSVENPITFFGLYDGANTPSNSVIPIDLYDATEFAAWVPFDDTIGVAFSEDITMTSGGAIDWNGVTNITSWAIGNNINHTDDGDSTDGGEGSSADLVQITVDDVLSLANDDHQQIMDFTAVIEDTSGNPADNAQVVINDLMPPFVVYAYWDGGLTIKFNETIAPCIDSNVCSPDRVTLREVDGGHDDIDLDGATLTDVDGGTDNLLIIPAGNLAGVTGGENFPTTSDSTWALVYDEQIYDDLGFASASPYGHGGLEWGEIVDARGNSWSDYNNGVHNKGDTIYYDTQDNKLCNAPVFAPADVLGPFTVTGIGVSNFAEDLPTACTGSPGNTGAMGAAVNHVMTYSFSHPLNLESQYWEGVSTEFSCLASMCTLQEVNDGMSNGSWVDDNVQISTGLDIPPTTVGQSSYLSGVSAVLATDRMSMQITIQNNTNPCYTWEEGNFLNPEWVVWSAFNVGTGKDLNLQVTPQ